MKGLKQSHSVDESHKRALSIPEQELFLGFMKPETSRYNHWYNIFAVMIGAGLRVGEATGLRWSDIHIEHGIIDVNHTLVYYCHRNAKTGNSCYFGINTPKTKAGQRQIPMQQYVKEAFIREKECQELNNLRCKVFIVLSRHC